MWDHRYLRQIDFRMIPLLLALMWISLLVISATTGEEGIETLWTPMAKSQAGWFLLGWGIYLLFAGMDYHKLRDWTWLLYGVTLLLLIGLFFTTPIQNVHRWYRLPFVGRAFQPSEYAKLSVVIALSWFLESRGREAGRLSATLQALVIVLVPFFLILKQPDLGTAMVLFPISLGMFYFGGLHSKVVRLMGTMAVVGLSLITLVFTGVISHEGLRPYATKVLKEYQYERLNPNTYHQKAAQTAIALGGMTGSGWHQSEFTGRNWLPAAATDSVFAAFTEEFGLVGAALMLLLFLGLFYFSFQVVAVAPDSFGRLLSAGIAIYLAMHVVVNIGMMCGFLPITGVPLILVTYGGSSVLSTMMALGILQSIYSRRFLFH
jgi:rod shape determining protein RodA